MFRILVEDQNEAPMDLQCSGRRRDETRRTAILDIDQTGFCTAVDEDWNQTLTFKINATAQANETFLELVCTDNGYPSLSVSKSSRSFVAIFIDLLGS